MTSNHYDIILLADLRLDDGAMDGLAEWLAIVGKQGYRIGLLQLKSVMLDRPLARHAAIDVLVGRQVVEVIDPELPAHAHLLVGADLRLFTHRPRRRLKIGADHRLVMVNRSLIDAEGRMGVDVA